MTRDTTAEMADVQEQSYRAMGEGRRLEVAFALSDFAHALAVAGFKVRCGAVSDEEARVQLASALYGVEPGT